MKLKLSLPKETKTCDKIAVHLQLITKEFLIIKKERGGGRGEEGEDTNQLSHESFCSGQKPPKLDKRHD